MTEPQPVAPQALVELRRRFAWLVLALVLPVLVAAAYLAEQQYETHREILLREAAQSVERRVQRIEPVLRSLGNDLLRLRDLARGDLGIESATLIDAALLREGRVDGGHTLDAMPALLRDRASQVIVADATGDSDAFESMVRRAAAFGEQAFLSQAHERLFERAYFVGDAQDEIWMYPWEHSAELLRTYDAATLAELHSKLGRGAGIALGSGIGAIDWRPWRDARGAGWVTLSTAVQHERFRGRVALDVRVELLQRLLASGGSRRRGVRWEPGGGVGPPPRPPPPPPPLASADGPPSIRPAMLEEARSSELAVPDGRFIVTARAIGGAPWVLRGYVDAAALEGALLARLAPYLVTVASLLLLFGAGMVVLWLGFTAPALRLVDYLQRLAQRSDVPEPRVPTPWRPWMWLTRDTFAAWREAAAREQRSEALKASIVDHALAALVSSDADGRIVEFNPAAEAMFGRALAEVVGRNVGDVIVPPRYRDAHEAAMGRMRAGGAPRISGKRLELHALRADGSEFPVEIVLWRTEVNGETHFTASLFDLTERHTAAREIERQREALRQSEKLAAMGSLLAGVAHELNNPLAIVMGRASLLEEKCQDAPALRSDAQRIREAAERCGRIVRTFLDMARSRPAQRRRVALNELVRAAADLLHYGFRTHGIELQLDLADGLPSVDADPDQLGQIVMNLLVNAQQELASADGARRVRVQTGVDASSAGREPRVWLRVADNGPGVAPALHDAIFEPFFTTKDEGAGTGLGLSVSRSVAREHGGDLTLEAFDRGASFRLVLPVSGAEPAAAEDASVPEDDAPSTARVLVVDDEAELSDLMRDMLESAGYDVATAEAGEVALELLDTARFDAIVSDLRMPGVDGAALWDEVSRRHPALARRMLFVTGDTLSPDVREFLRTAQCAALDKPFTKEELLARVGALLR